MLDFINISFRINGLNEDFRKEEIEMRGRANVALFDIGIEMQHDLKSILQKEWYSKYTPKQYERRTDNSSLGRPLGDDYNFHINVTPNREGSTLNFMYEPTGEHANQEWYERNGDALIKWIQEEHNYAETEGGEILSTIPARPFWNKFIDEQSKGGIIRKFKYGMLPYYQIEEDATDKKAMEELESESILQVETVKVHKI